MIVLDTHVWVWWVSGAAPLSRKAETAVQKAVEQKALAISSISTWEIALLVARGRLELSLDVKEWVARTEALPFAQFVPVDNAIALRAVGLPEPLHSDPADRIIVATALALGAALVTRDERLRRYRPVKTIW